MSFDDVVIVTVERNDYQIHFWILTKGEAVSRMKNADFEVKKVDNYDYEKKLKIIYYSDDK